MDTLRARRKNERTKERTKERKRKKLRSDEQTTGLSSRRKRKQQTRTNQEKNKINCDMGIYTNNIKKKYTKQT